MQPVLIGIAGPSGAGKSVFCKRLEEEDPRVLRFKFDNFYVDASEVETHPSGYQYWDHPQSIRWEELREALRHLQRGEAAWVPDYSKAEDRTVGMVRVEPRPLMLVDGIQVLWDEEIRDLLSDSLYFDVPEPLQLDRRIARQPDVNQEYLWRVMLPANRAFLEPTKRYAGHLVDAALPLEQVYRRARSLLAPQFAKLDAYASHLL